MKSLTSPSLLLHSKLLTGLAFVGLTAFGATTQANAATALYLAFGVDTLESSANHHRIRVRDHHINHYHNFSSNTSNPLPLVPGSSVSITLGAMNFAPDAEARYTIPDGGVGSHLHVVLLSLTGPDPLSVHFGHGTPTGELLVGADAHLEIDEPTDLFFTLDSSAAPGRYTAEFQLIDEAGLYLDSPSFTVHFDAVPEPSSFLLAAGAGGLALIRRRR